MRESTNLIADHKVQCAYLQNDSQCADYQAKHLIQTVKLSLSDVGDT